MNVKEKLIEILRKPIFPHELADPIEAVADYLLDSGVTVQECKVAEIDKFKLPIDDAILILKEEYKQMVDGYATHLSYGGNGDPAEEVHIDALGMAIAALELQKQIFPYHQKEND